MLHPGAESLARAYRAIEKIERLLRIAGDGIYARRIVEHGKIRRLDGDCFLETGEAFLPFAELHEQRSRQVPRANVVWARPQDAVGRVDRALTCFTSLALLPDPLVGHRQERESVVVVRIEPGRLLIGSHSVAVAARREQISRVAVPGIAQARRKGDRLAEAFVRLIVAP